MSILDHPLFTPEGDACFLQWARGSHERGDSVDDATECMMAASGGHIRTLTFLHEAEYTWDVRTCSAAARNGYLDCLQYAHEHGCPWDENTTVYAALANHVACLRYAVEHGCPLDRLGIASARWAFVCLGNGDDSYRYVHSLGGETRRFLVGLDAEARWKSVRVLVKTQAIVRYWKGRVTG